MDEALALIVDLDLTTAQDNSMRLFAVERGCMLYPAYKKVAKVKSKCLPPPESIAVLPDQAEVSLQSLLNHTVDRLLQMQEPVLESLADKTPIQPTLHCKWGMDGSSGHSAYKQSGVREDDEMFATTLVPLQLQTECGIVVWRNSTPSSTRFCRPIRLQLAKETKALTEQEMQQVSSKISALESFRIQTAVVHYQLMMSMVDGKIVNVATETVSSQRCSMCGLTMKRFNDLAVVAAQPVTNLQYGLSTLHCWIRCFDCLLHLSYRLPEGHDSKKHRKQRKHEVKEALRTRMGLRVDEPRAGGSGNSNDGNTARRAFRSPADFAACTGVDEQLISQVNTILEDISCFHRLQSDALSVYCKKTAERFVRLYN